MKKKIILWTNCQGSVIEFMLKKYYNHSFDIKHYTNYTYIKEKKTLPEEFRNPDIFIYQNYSEKEDTIYDLKYLLNQILNKDCIKICIPFLQFDAYFCYDTHDLNNNKTISNKYPHGMFFFGMDIVTNFLKDINLNTIDKDILINNIINNVTKDDAISSDKILYYYNRSFDYLEKKILNSDVPRLYDFIKTNFTSKRLFHNRNHPTSILFNELIKDIFIILQLKYTPSDKDMEIMDSLLNDWIMPILPSVKIYYNIYFEDKCSSWYHKEIIDTRSHIYNYLNKIYFCYII